MSRLHLCRLKIEVDTRNHDYSKTMSVYKTSNYSEDICAVCLEVPRQFETQTCGHAFCSDCMTNMIKRRINEKAIPCPLCRVGMSSTERRWILVPPKPNASMNRLAQILVYGACAAGFAVFIITHFVKRTRRLDDLFCAIILIAAIRIMRTVIFPWIWGTRAVK